VDLNECTSVIPLIVFNCTSRK